MTLTQEDLQAIGLVVDERIEKKLTAKLKPIKKDIKTLINFFDHELLGHEKRISGIEKHLHLNQTD